jgi:primary-amine oxidase
MQVGLGGILVAKGATYENVNQVSDQEYIYGTLLGESMTNSSHITLTWTLMAQTIHL